MDLFYRKWIGTAPNLTLSPAEELSDSVAVAAYGHNGFRGEAAINITEVVFGGTATCLAFANIIPSTVTGNSDTADYKDTILQPGLDLANCGTTTTTTPVDSAGTAIPTAGVSITTNGVVEVKDSAVIALTTGTAVPGGTIDFTLCEANTALSATCDVGGKSVLVGNDIAVTDVDNAFPVTVTSPSAYVTAAGRYCWKADYTGDSTAGYTGSSDVSVGECFVVTPVTPELDTVAGADVTLGTAITDTATLVGTAPKPTTDVIHTVSNPVPATRTAAGGTISFTLWGPTAPGATGCGAQVAGVTPSVTVSGDRSGASSYGPVSHTPTAPGVYHWKASYNGDSPNTLGDSHNSLCDDTDEDVEVTTVTPTLATAQKWVPNDDATITASAGGHLVGDVTFTLYPTTNCTGTPVYGPVDVPMPANAGLTKTVSTSNTTAITTTGTSQFSWSVSYDSDNAAQNDLAATCHEVSTLTIDNDNSN